MRQERWGLPEGGLTSTFNRAEMRAAERTQNRSLFWLEAVVAADTRGRVQDGRRRRAVAPRREPASPPLDDRPPGPLPPPLPARARAADALVSASLVSAAEVAHLLELPSARMKGVPVRRMTLPRIPAPPEVMRGGQRTPRRQTPRPGAHERSCHHCHVDDRRGTSPPAAASDRRPAVTTDDHRPEDLYPMLRAENAEVVIHPDDRKYGALLVGGQGTGKTRALLTLLPQRHRGRRRGADRDRPQVRAGAPVPAHDAARLRQARVVPRPRPPGVRDEPAAADRRPAAGDRGRADRRERRRRAARHQREPDLPVLAPLPLPRGDRRDRDRRPTRSAARSSRTSTRCCGRREDDFRATVAEACATARPRPDRRVLPLRAARRSADEPRARGRAAGRAAQQDLRADRRAAAAALLQPPHRRPAAGDHRGARHPDRRRQHGARSGPRTARRACCSSCGCCTRSCSARSTCPRPSARACRCWSTRRTTSLGAENVVDQIATHRAAGLEPAFGAAVLRAARLGLRAPGEDPQGRAQPAAEPVPVPDGRRRRTPRRPAGSRWPSTRR